MFCNFIHCTAIFQAISFSIRYSILFFCLLFCFLELHIYPSLGRRRRAGQGRAGSFGVAQRRSQSSKSRGLFGAAACSGGKLDDGTGGAEAGAHLDGFTFGRAACFDTGELNTIVQYLFNVNEKRQTRQGERGKRSRKHGGLFNTVLRSYIRGCSSQWYWTLCRFESLSFSVCVFRVLNVPMHSSKLKLEIKCLRSTKILNEKVIAFPADLRDCKRAL